ncbi:tetratricopeptide repeat protein [bacterium]|nr:tetratricopeptide repeat protein [bacterium]
MVLLLLDNAELEPAFECDVFVSFASGEVESRWIRWFKGWLQRGQETGFLGNYRIRIFDEEFSKKHEGEEKSRVWFAERSVLFVPVISPAYASSQTCQHERDAFLRESGGELRDRIFPIRLDNGDVPKVFADVELSVIRTETDASIVARNLAITFENRLEGIARRVKQWDQVRTVLSPNGRALLQRLSWMAAAPVPFSLITGLEDTVSELVKHSLVVQDTDTPTLSVESVIQQLTRRSIREELRLESLQSALNAAMEALPEEHVRGWPVGNSLLPHLRLLIAHAEAHGITSPTAALMGHVVHILYEKAELEEAEPLLRRMLAINEQSYGAEHPKVVIGLSNLAQLFLDTNRLAEAEPLLRRALVIDERAYGMEHPHVANCLINLAKLLLATNRLAEAEPLLRRALAIDERAYGKEHPHIANCLNNLAQLLLATNRLVEAEPLLRRALAIDEQAYGMEHPHVANCLNNLARLLTTAGRTADALPLAERALSIQERTWLGPHPQLADVLVTLAEVRQELGELDEAERHVRRALEIDEASFSSPHPKLSRDLNRLAEVLFEQNDLSGAEAEARRAAEISEQPPGPDHPDHARDLCMLAKIHQANGRLSEAELLFMRALEIYRSSFDSDHPRILEAETRLAEIRGVPKPNLASPVDLEVPDLVTLAYRLVAARRSEWTLLSSLRGDGKSAAYTEMRHAAEEIRRAAAELCPDSDQPLRDANELLGERLQGLEPPPLWDTWIRTVYERRLIRVADEVRK